MGKKTQAGVQHLLYQLFIITLASLPPTSQIPHPANIVFLKCNADNMDMKSSTDWNENIVNVEQPSRQVFYLLCMGSNIGKMCFGLFN